MILDGVLGLLSIAGIALSVVGVRLTRAGCRGGECPLLFRTPYARILGFANAWPALAYFVALVAVAVARLAHVGVPLWPALFAAGLSLALSFYLAGVLVFALKSG